MNKFAIKGLIAIIASIILLSGHAMAAVKISSIPLPPSTAKLRVLVVVVTTEAKSAKRPVLWIVSPEELENSNSKAINRLLKNQGIYEVVPPEDIYAVLGDQVISSRDWTAKDWALAKDVGRALHADYVLLFERSQQVHLQFDMSLINLNTGKQFSVSSYIPSNLSGRMINDERKQAGAEAIKINYRQLFTEAKNDLLQTAIVKGRIIPKKPPKPAQGDSAQPRKSFVPLDKADLSETLTPETKAKEKKLVFEKELEKTFSTKNKKSVSPRLVVYDFDAVDQMKVVGLILTEALREELHNLGGFVLVNRENILKIMDEYKLQQSSLVDEKQVVKVGQWLAASEAVTGNLAILGNTSILQVKRIDIKTMGTLSLGSLKCPAGKEEQLLNNINELARKLVQSP
jgi:hypothetical protein